MSRNEDDILAKDDAKYLEEILLKEQQKKQEAREKAKQEARKKEKEKKNK